MYALTMKLLQMSLQGALLIFAAALIRTALLRFLPKQMLCLLWVPAILALLIPLPTLFSLSLDLPEPGREEPILAEGETVRMDWDSWTAPASPEAPGAEAAGGETGRRGTPPLLPLVWLSGMGLLGAGVLALYLREYSRLRRALLLTGEAAEAWRRAHPTRRPLTLGVLPELRGPMTYGVLRPGILLGSEPNWGSLPDRLALEHEYVHVRHLDAAWKLLLHLLLILHWYNPVVWLMYLLMSRDLELSCDETVLLRFGGESRADFAMVLVNTCRKGRLAPFPSLGAVGLRERISSIMRFRRAGPARRGLASVLVLCLAFCAFCSLRVGAAGEMLYRSGDLTLSVPRELRDLLIVETPDRTGEGEDILFRVLERESWEAGKQLYPNSRREYGLILTIQRVDEATAGKYLRQVTAWDLLARDDRGNYYMVKHSTIESNMLTSPQTEDQSARWERRKLVNAWVRDLRGHLRWVRDPRTAYPAYSSAVSSYLSSVLTNRNHRYLISWGEAGSCAMTGSNSGDPFLERLTWETASASVRVSDVPREEPIVVTQPFRDTDLYFWPGSDLVLCCSNDRELDNTRYWYTVSLLDEPEAKVGDLAAAWFRAVSTE